MREGGSRFPATFLNIFLCAITGDGGGKDEEGVRSAEGVSESVPSSVEFTATHTATATRMMGRVREHTMHALQHVTWRERKTQ